jgi:hypothetical protein
MWVLITVVIIIIVYNDSACYPGPSPNIKLFFPWSSKDYVFLYVVSKEMESLYDGILYRYSSEFFFRSDSKHNVTKYNSTLNEKTIMIFFCNPIAFAICSSTMNKLCKNVYSGMYVEECSVALLYN